MGQIRIDGGELEEPDSEKKETGPKKVAARPQIDEDDIVSMPEPPVLILHTRSGTESISLGHENGESPSAYRKRIRERIADRLHRVPGIEYSPECMEHLPRRYANAVVSDNITAGQWRKLAKFPHHQRHCKRYKKTLLAVIDRIRVRRRKKDIRRVSYKGFSPNQITTLRAVDLVGKLVNNDFHWKGQRRLFHSIRMALRQMTLRLYDTPVQQPIEVSIKRHWMMRHRVKLLAEGRDPYYEYELHLHWAECEVV